MTRETTLKNRDFWIERVRFLKKLRRQLVEKRVAVYPYDTESRLTDDHLDHCIKAAEGYVVNYTLALMMEDYD